MILSSRRDLLALAASLMAGPALAQTTAAGQAAPAPETVAVALETPLGRIVAGLATRAAPITCANFLRYVDRKLYDGAVFFRASRPPNATGDDSGLVEAGLPGHPEKLLASIAHESTLQTGLSHLDGTLSMARNAPGTAQADFFICVGEQAYLNADPANPANPGFAAFGRVTQGMDVVRKILVLPVDPQKGEGAMKGEMLRDPVPIVSARRL